jgi:hypothetical protein
VAFRLGWLASGGKFAMIDGAGFLSGGGAVACAVSQQCVLANRTGIGILNYLMAGERSVAARFAIAAGLNNKANSL